MSIEPRPSRTTSIFGVALLLLTLLCWIGFVVNATSMHESDAAGNAMTQGFAFLLGSAAWILLALTLLVAGLRGTMPNWAMIAACLLVPASAAASLATLQLFAANDYPANWLFVVPILTPPFMGSYALWAHVPQIRGRIPATLAGSVVWGCVLVLTLLPWPVIIKASRLRHEIRVERDRIYAMEEAQRLAKERQEWLAKFEQLPKNAPLWCWREFTEHGEELRQMAFEGIRQLARRQADAEQLLDQGFAFPMLELPNLSLEVTPALCEHARKFLRERVKQISPPVPGRPYDWEKQAIDPYLASIEWLVQHACDCRDELAQVEAAVRAYPEAADRNRTLATLARIRQLR